jgi:hypothetical protein
VKRKLGFNKLRRMVALGGLAITRFASSALISYGGISQTLDLHAGDADSAFLLSRQRSCVDDDIHVKTHVQESRKEPFDRELGEPAPYDLRQSSQPVSAQQAPCEQ